LLIDKSIQITPVMRSVRPARVVPQVSQVLLLAGGVRSKGFRTQLGRHILDLPVDGEKRLMDLWEGEIAAASSELGWKGVEVKVLVDGASPAPRCGVDGERRFRIERDVRGFRGTGGVVRDACDGAREGAHILVCHAFQILCEPLARIVERLFDVGGGLCFESEPGGVGGVFLMKSECLSSIPKVGFVDFKEQAIPMIAKGHRVRVAESRGCSGFAVRSLSEYLRALRFYHGSGDRGFAVVEPGAVVGKKARLHDSVVLNGGWVGAGAILAGSVVAAGGMVANGTCVVHDVVNGTDGRMGGMA
jgi:hypothetical protein